MREVQRLLIPANVQAEASLLGGMMLNPDGIARLTRLDPEAFYDPLHASAFRAVQSLYTKGLPIDVIAVHMEIHAQGGEAGIEELYELTTHAPGPASMRMFAGAIADAHRLRQLMQSGQTISNLAMTPGRSSAEQIDKAQLMLAKLATVRSARDPKHISQSLGDYMALLQDLSEGKNPAIPTGIGGLDELLNGGIRRGEMFVLGARPKHGKTAVSLAMARNMARAHTVLFLSQEMSISQLMHRHTAATGPFDLRRILAAKAEDAEMWAAVTKAAGRLGELHLVHDEQCNLNLMDIRRKAVKVKREHGLDVMFVDFLQLMAGAGEESRNRELDVIVNGIKGLAMDLDMAVVVLSQMSREADKTYGRPTMTHLRDSGAIEAAADQIALLFTDWAHPMSKKLPAFKGYAELDVVAHRNGPQGMVPIELVGMYQQIGDWMGEIPKRAAESERRTPSNI